MDYLKNQLGSSELGQVMRDTMHEVREFNRVIKAQSEMLTKLLKIDSPGESLKLNAQNADSARNQAVAILETAQMVSARVDLIDFETNPGIFAESKITANVYRKFDKAQKMLRSRAAAKRVKIKLTGASHSKLDLYTVFDIFPFLLLQNAVKYAPPQSEIAVTFEEVRRAVCVTVTSIGPVVQPDELQNIGQKGFRSAAAERCSREGSGFGLYFATYIAELHGFTLEFCSGDALFDFNSVEYSEFTVSFDIQM